MKGTFVKRLCCFSIAFVNLFVTYFATPAKVIADEIETERNLQIYAENTLFGKETQVDHSRLVGELVDQRSESEKQFRRADGLTEAVVYPYPVHYQENGEWKDIDNTLIPLDGEVGYRTRDGADVQFGASLSSKELVRYEWEGQPVAWRFLRLEGGEAKIVSAESAELAGLNKDERRDMEMRFPETLSSTIVYEDLESGASIRYVLTSYILTEYITLSEKPEEKVAFQLELQCEGLQPIMDADGSIRFINDTEETVFAMGIPVMDDANGEQCEDFDVSLMTAETFAEWIETEQVARAARVNTDASNRETETPIIPPESNSASPSRRTPVQNVEDSIAEETKPEEPFLPIRLNIAPDDPNSDIESIPEFYQPMDADEAMTASLFLFTDGEGTEYYRVYGSYREEIGFYACDAFAEDVILDTVFTAEEDVELWSFGREEEFLALEKEEAADEVSDVEIPIAEEGAAESETEEPEDANASAETETELTELDQEAYILEDIPLPEYSLAGTNEYTFVYMIVPDMEWLLDETRAYPVVIDPDIRPTFSGSVDDTYISYSSQSSNYNTRDRLKIGGTPHYRSLIRINGLPSLETGDVIVEATLNLSRYNTSSAYNKEIDLYKVLTAWDFSTVTWSSFQPDSTSSVEREHISAVAATCGQNKFNQFDITDLVKFWYANPSQNFGVLLESWKESSNWYTEYRSSNYNSTYSGHPYFSIIYVSSTGLEDRFTYHSQSAGRAGMGAINDFSGNLTWTHADASIANGILPISLSHVYNTNDLTTDIGYGYGWRLNYSQSLKKVELENRTETATYYQLTDGDGTRHYYKYSSANTYVNELDHDSTLTISGNTVTIVDKGGNKRIFDCDSAVENGRLTTVEDANGNQTLISYSSTTITDLQISSIQEKLSGQSAGQSLTLSYSENRLSSVASPDGRNVSYTYSLGDLTEISYADGKICSYAYSNHCMTQARNIDSYNLNYTYNSAAPYRVTKVEEKAGATTGQYLSFDYGWNRTTVWDKQGRDTTYQFDNNGQAVSVRDSAGNAVYAAYNTDDRTVTQLSAVSKMQSTVFNLLKNHGFETTSSSGNPWTRSNTSYVTFASTYAHTGKYSLKMVSAASRMVDATQTASVTAGETYTFSAYFSGQAGAKLQVLNGSDVLATSDSVTTAGTVGAEWTRGSVTFTVPSGVTSVTVKIELPSDSAGTVYVDSAQLEVGASPNRYNMIQNGDFSDGTTAWTTSSRISSSTDGVTTDSDASHPAAFSNSVYHITGTCDYQKYIYQAITVAGKKGDTYSFGAWLRSDSVPLTTQPNGSSTRLYGVKRISVEFLNGSKTVNTATIYFNADTNDWQFACGSAVATGAYTSIRLNLNFHYTRNDCYYDGVQLYKEEFSQAYTYDSSGNLTGYTSLIGQQNTFTYNSSNDVTKSTDPRGNTTTYTYDDHHNLLTSTSPEGVVTSNTYHDVGLPTETRVGTDTNYIRSTTAYDNASALATSVTDARGSAVLTQYNAATRLATEITDAKNNSTAYGYDSLNRVSSIISGDSGVSYTYTNDKLTQVDVDGAVLYGLTYDGFGRTISTKAGSSADSMAALATNAYDGDTGLLTQTQYGNGFTVSYVYDNLDRITEVKYDGTTVYKYVYDGSGNLYSACDAALGFTIYYEYDHTDRCVKSCTKDNATGAIRSSYSYQYDVNNNLIKLTCSTNGTTWATTYTYDKDNRPITATLASGSAIMNTYDSIGRLSTKSIGAYTTTLSYLAGINGSQTAMVSSYQNGTDAAYQYEYDANGNITHIQQGDTHLYYQYDALNQLVREDNSILNKSITYTYDDRGNILNKTEYAYVANGGTLGAAADTITYGYESEYQAWADQLTSYDGEAIRYDASGNPTTYRGYTMTWNGRQLATATNGTNTISYSYDENGIRTQKTVNGVVTNYNYHGSVLISQVTGNDTLLFSYDASGNIVAVNYNGTYYYYVRNGQNDIIRLIDGDNNTVVEYAYDSWGTPLSTTGTLATTLGVQNPFRYRGYVYDEETCWYYLQSRYYDPNVCRFLSADVMFSTGQGVLGHNMYAYCRNNAPTRIDIGGTEDETVYIFYTAYTGEEASNGDGDFSKQAEYYQQKNNTANVIMKKVNTVQEFVNEWNLMQGKIKKVYIFSHGNGMSLIFKNGEGISASGKNLKGESITSISSLQQKTIGSLYLMSCNSGHVDLFVETDNNAAAAFCRLGGIDDVYAFDGNMSFGIFFGYAARLSFKQNGFRSVYSNFGLHSKCGIPKGWIIYRLAT